MVIPENITKTHLLNAIEKIDIEGIPNDSDSQYYDVLYNGKRYPPKLIISYANLFANGTNLDRNTFSGGLNTPCFKLLEENGFIIVKKDKRDSGQPNFWIEKTIVHKREDRKIGDRALGKALWSPQRDKGGSDIYKNMRLVKNGDVVLHLIDNKYFSGISKVINEFYETIGLVGTAWNVPSYLIELDNYTPLDPKIDRADLLNDQNRLLLNSIADKSEVFYNNKLNLREGAYLTPCPSELLLLINHIYKNLSSKNLPFTENVIFGSTNKVTMVRFDIKPLVQSFKKVNLKISENLVSRFTASLLTKPFVILTGLSGSGKTKLAHAFARWICENKTQYCVVPVGADWTNREPLLGFPNALKEKDYIKPDNRVLDLILLANANLTKPYFLILDEMNLSHVERYFADFLSVIETKNNISFHAGNENWNGVPAEISFPSNLFIIGTVNIDETTYMFSPKVLDRANVIEFRVTADEMRNFLQNNLNINLEGLEGQGATMSASFVEIAKNDSLKVADTDELNKSLLSFFSELKKIGAEFGYRSASEILRFVAVFNQIESAWSMSDIIDAAIMQKLLPKVHGSRRKLEPVLKTLGTLCLQDGQKFDDYLKTPELIAVKYPISLEKIIRMHDNLISNGFTSYAEA